MKPIPASGPRNEHGPRSTDTEVKGRIPGKDELLFAPDPNEVSRRAYFSFLNEGCPMGKDVQHWLTAEAEMIAERDKTRKHGFHNPT